MPPQRTRYNNADESRPETSLTRERGPTLAGVGLPSKSKRNGNQFLGGSTLKDGGNAVQAVVSSADAQTSASKMDWPDVDSSVLHAYRYALHLDTPPAFTDSRNERLLSQPGIGQMSPTMARPQSRRRIGKDELAIRVRKDFNAAIIHEQEIITSMLYVIQNHDRTLKVQLDTPSGKG